MFDAAISASSVIILQIFIKADVCINLFVHSDAHIHIKIDKNLRTIEMKCKKEVSTNLGAFNVIKNEELKGLLR